MQQIRQCHDRQEWDETIQSLHGHPLQLWGWGEVKSVNGWNVDRIFVERAGNTIGAAQLLVKPLPRPFRAMVYIPRGPVGEDVYGEDVRQSIADYCKKTYRPTLITAEPDKVGAVTWKSWRRSKNRILLARTATMDLTKTDEELLAAMSKKTRQYIRKSSGEGVVVRKAETADDVSACLDIYRQTAKRAGFSLHDDGYYHAIFTSLGDDSPVYMAEYQGRTVAFLWPIVTAEIAFELYGGMTDEGQALRANYHLKWQVIQAMKERSVRRYDVNGLLNDGVSAFKKGFIPEETQMAGTLDKPLSSLYPIWSVLLPAVKRMLQRLRR